MITVYDDDGIPATVDGTGYYGMLVGS